MTSTPARSSASTRISRPNISGPTSARGLAEDFAVRDAGFAAALFFPDSDVLLIAFLVLAAARDNKKPTTVSSRGFLSKFFLLPTSTNGVVRYYYDDYAQDCLSDIAEHWHKAYGLNVLCQDNIQESSLLS
ncbi:MAG TPA: hypothetical protein VEH04_20420 [Verrucomicrobiae bacterium]|nr:hypothetical protein [Verrucomicrobiae bacterium]